MAAKNDVGWHYQVQYPVKGAKIQNLNFLLINLVHVAIVKLSQFGFKLCQINLLKIVPFIK